MRPSIRAALVLPWLLVLVSCASTGGEAAYNLKSFLSPENQREVLFEGRTDPRLHSRRRGRTGYVDTSRINGADRRGRRRALGGYETSAARGGRARVVAGPDGTVPDATGVPGGRRFDAAERVTLNFENEPLPDVIQRILGGVLRVNYVADPDIQGAVTFRTEQPLSADQVLGVLRDILARNDLAIRRINGVYQIGSPDEILLLEANAEISQLQDDTTRVVKLDKGNAVEFAEVLQALVPTGTRVTAIESSNSLIVKGRPEDFASVRSLVDTLVDTGVADQRIAIVPLREAPPETVASQVLAAYAAPGLPAVTVVPLENRSALLVSSASARTVGEVRRLARELDADLGEKVSLRVLQLTHLSADEIAAQISTIFGGEVAVVDADDVGGGSNILAAGRARAAGGTDARTGDVIENAAGGDDIAGDPATRVPVGPNDTAVVDTGLGAAVIPGGDGLAIVANPRTNSLLIRSTFDQFQRIREVARALDIADGQVVIEATILEVDINDRLKYGVQFFLEANGFSLRSSLAAGGVADPGGAGLASVARGSIGGLNIDVVVDALQAITDVKVVSSPYLTVVNNATARLAVGDQIPFTTASQTSNSNGAVTVTQEVETRDTGVILEVTPRIRPDNSVLLEIVQEISTPRDANTGTGGNPVIAQRSITSQITVDSGGTALLGGLIQETRRFVENGVPILRKVPILGALFRQRDGTNNRSELVVLITPRVVRSSGQLEHLTQQLRWQTSIRPTVIAKP